MLSAGKGRIEVILGPMFSGKTTELIRRITRFQFAKFNCIVFKYAGDVRYSDKDASTHDQRTISAISATMLLVKKILITVKFEAHLIFSGPYINSL